MKYLKYTYIDAVSGVPVTESPATNGPTTPAIAGLVFEWAAESQYPSPTPVFYGTCPANSDTAAAGVLSVLTKPEWDQELEAELALRAKKYAAQIAARRYTAEIAGITINGIPVDTGRDSQALITGAVVSAMLDPDYSVRWKGLSGFVSLTAEQIIFIASSVRAHVQACFDREDELLELLVLGDFDSSMIDEGWPGEQIPETA